MAGKPLTNRVPATPPPDPAAAPASAPDPTLTAYAPLARLLSGGDLAVPSGRTAALGEALGALVGQRAQGVRNSGRLVTAQVQEVAARAPRSRWAALNGIGYGVLAAGVLWLLVQGIIAAVAWSTDHWTTLQYGDPRTTHLSATFGWAEETPLNPTTITAVTAPGVAHIFVLPGDRSDKAFVLDVPLPADPDGRQPLHLSAEDVDHDGHPDLLVQSGEGLVYPYLLDTGKQTFRPPTAGEQGRLGLGRR